MARRPIYHASIDFVQLLDEKGELDLSGGESALKDSDVKNLYEKMIICRAFDEAAFKLQRSGRMGTFPQNKGQEAIALGTAFAMRKGVDYLVPYYRENPALFLHGLPMHYALLHWMGDERGNAIPHNLSMNPICVAIGTQVLHAAGIAWAHKLQKQDRATVCFFGEGATSTGDFHEGMNFASVYQLPVVFICVNNQYAISTPIGKQSHAKTFAQKALGYDVPAVQVDGNDLFGVHQVVSEGIARARKGEGPSFVEAITYRLGDHTTADDARRYRKNDEVEAAVLRDPMVRTRKYLEAKKLWSEAEQTAAVERAGTIVHEVVKVALEIEKSKFDEVFDHVFAELPAELLRQKQTLRTDSIGQEPGQIEQPARHVEPGVS